MRLASKKEKDLDQHRWGEQHDEGTVTKTQGPGTRNGSGNRQVPEQPSRLAARHQLPGWAWAHRGSSRSAGISQFLPGFLWSAAMGPQAGVLSEPPLSIKWGKNLYHPAELWEQ